ncbi:MAG: ABC transporter ATP-binding protein [Peptococcaceae bacterium]
MTEDVIIKANKLCLQSGKRYLLRDIDWEVKRGEHWLVFGMNGCGKTTLLGTVAGFKSQTGGTLEVFGQPYTNENILELRSKIGWVSGSFFDKCYSHESALNIVLSGLFGTLGIQFSITDTQIRQAKALLREMRMGEKINTPFDFMSKGEQQNVLIARALMAEPEILVLDEPGTGLDVYAREHMLQTVQELAEKRQVTVIYVTHYPEEIQPFLQKTLLMQDGKVFAQGNTEDIMTSENISALLQDTVTIQHEAGNHIRMLLDASSAVGEICYTGKEA